MTPADIHDPTPTPDEIALPAFEDALWAALRVEHEHARAEASGATATPASSADDAGDHVDVVPAPIAAPPRRRALRRTLATAAAVALLGAAALLAVRAGGDGSEERPIATDPTTAPPTTAPPPTIAVEDAVATALTDLAETHVVGTEKRTGGVLVQRGWADQVSGGLHTFGYRADGETARFELGLASPPDPGDGPLVDPVLRAVDHCVGQYSETVGPTMSGADDLSRLAADLREGRAIVDGTEVVDGRELLAVRWVTRTLALDPETGAPASDPETGEPVFADPPVTTVIPSPTTYLDPETYAPVSLRTDVEPQEVTVYLLRPRDPSNLELLVAAIPAGATRVDAVRTDAERAAAGCT